VLIFKKRDVNYIERYIENIKADVSFKVNDELDNII